jgi:hypothetical protein
MVRFTTILKKFDEKGEKTGWIYLEITAELAEELNPGVRTSYRVKGRLDEYELRQAALLPMGDGTFVFPTNAEIRRAIRKRDGATVRVEMEVDHSPIALCSDLLDCLADAPEALAFFNSLPKGHQNYYSKWIESAKTTDTRVKRITQAVQGMAMGMGYGEMIRYFKNKA